MFECLRLKLGTAVVAGTIAIGGFTGAAVVAGEVADRLAVTSDPTTPNGIFVGKGEDAAALKKAAENPITRYEDEAKIGSGEAPRKVLIDNDVTRVTLVAFKKGYIRAGDQRRRYHQLLVYVDEGRYSIMKGAGGPRTDKPIPSRHAPGSSVFHYKDSIVSESRIDEDYRVLFVEMKK